MEPNIFIIFFFSEREQEQQQQAMSGGFYAKSVPGFHLSSVAVGQGRPIREDAALVVGDAVVFLQGFRHYLKQRKKN